MAYVERGYLTEQFEILLHDDNIMCPVVKVLDALEIIDTAPTADVVPKSEVENSIPIDVHEALKQRAKAEFAREIFAEIEKEIDTGLSVIEKILNSKGGRANGKTILISKYEVFIEAKKHLNKLKKKYTEDLNDGNA